MKQFRDKSNYILLAIITALSLLLIACGSSDGASSNETNQSIDESQVSNASTETPKKTVLRVGSSGIYPPFGFLGDDGKLQGYEVDVIEAVGEKLGYDIEWTIAEFAGLFGMMDSDRIDTIANLTVATDERKEKYDFTAPLAYSGAALIVKEDNNDIHSLEDLKGKTLGTLLGSNYHQDISKWNEENGNEIEIKAYQDLGGTYNEVALGRLDAFIDAWIAAPNRIKEEGLPLKLFSDEPLYYVDHALAFVRNEENKAFIEEFNQALEELREDGTLSEFSYKWGEIDISSR